VATRWNWPNPSEGITSADIVAAQQAVAAGLWRENVQARDWVGIPIASALGLDIDKPAGLEREVRPRFAPVIRNRGRALQLFRIESERLKLPAPFGRLIAEPLDAYAAGEATFYRCFDKIRGEESERDGRIDLPNAAFLASTKLSDRGHAT
jgi:hypothetical protein